MVGGVHVYLVRRVFIKQHCVIHGKEKRRSGRRSDKKDCLLLIKTEFDSKKDSRKMRTLS